MVKFITLVKNFKNNFYNPEKKYTFCPDMFYIGNKKGLNIFYSSLNGIIYALNKEEYESFKSKKTINENLKKEFVNSGLFVEETEIKYPDYSKNGLKTSTITIFPTNECNLKCVYCYGWGGDFKKVKIDFEIAKKFIDNYLDWNKERTVTEPIKIEFHGIGEPTMGFSEIKKIVEYVKLKFPRATFSIQTNGILNDTILNFLIDNGFIIGLSVDGPPYIQDIQRPTRNNTPSSSIVEETIQKLRENNIRVAVRVTVSKKIENKMLEILEYLRRLDVKSIKIAPLSNIGRCGNNISDYVKQPNSRVFIKNFLKSLELSDEFSVSYGSGISNLEIKDRHCGVPDPGMALTHEGYITSCYEAAIYNNINSPFIFGKYDKKIKDFVINQKKVKILKKWVIKNLPDCQPCFLKYSCAGDCPMRTYIKNREFFKTDIDRCEMKRVCTKKYVEYLIEKNFVKIIPYMKFKNGKLFFKMYFNEFLIEDIQNSGGSSIITINSSTSFEKTLKKILDIHQKNYTPKLFLLSIHIESFLLNSCLIEKLNFFLKELEKNKIYFKITKPLPFCITKKIENEIKTKYIPTSWKQSIDLFNVNEKDYIVFCNSKKSTKKIGYYSSREKICDEIKEGEIIAYSKICEECINKARNKCKGYFKF
ncbi:hypothetical protein A3K63_03585 [Candidatus Micrarchaeota archaeon RBG_16_49_10]|nr:MAG: hypothetical protein A3K63_03585 [Candidatus Micrarchaeota archaeon RBG_16_49_10]